jgi:hypothetical protein
MGVTLFRLPQDQTQTISNKNKDLLVHVPAKSKMTDIRYSQIHVLKPYPVSPHSLVLTPIGCSLCLGSGQVLPTLL